jgi:hypothetical protein
MVPLDLLATVSLRRESLVVSEPPPSHSAKKPPTETEAADFSAPIADFAAIWH